MDPVTLFMGLAALTKGIASAKRRYRQAIGQANRKASLGYENEDIHVENYDLCMSKRHLEKLDELGADGVLSAMMREGRFIKQGSS